MFSLLCMIKPSTRQLWSTPWDLKPQLEVLEIVNLLSITRCYLQIFWTGWTQLPTRSPLNRGRSHWDLKLLSRNWMNSLQESPLMISRRTSTSQDAQRPLRTTWVWSQNLRLKWESSLSRRPRREVMSSRSCWSAPLMLPPHHNLRHHTSGRR